MASETSTRPRQPSLSGEGTQYRASYYNILVEDREWTLLFNGVTSGMARLTRAQSESLAPFLGPPKDRRAGVGRSAWNPPTFAPDELPANVRPLFDELRRGQFFSPCADDQFVRLKERFEWAKKNDPFLVTITTTLDCNLGCYYCYEDKSPIYLTSEGCDAILSWVKGEIERKQHDRLYVDWYGGEPMLNQVAIEYFSGRAVAYCDAAGIPYSASMISNGTRWPHEAVDFVQRTRIRHVQFTLDGNRRDHDRRRRFVAPDERGRSSFDDIITTIDRLLGALRIYLRINVDPGSADQVLSLIPLFTAKGWLVPGAKVYPYLAMIGPMTEHCGFLGKSKRFLELSRRFDELNNEFQGAIARVLGPDELVHLQFYPASVRLNCAAVGQNSVVFGPDGFMYKCGLEVGQTNFAHDRLNVPPTVAPKGSVIPLRIVAGPRRVGEAHPWNEYDPFSHPRCSECQYLPICMGGCPKVQFEQDEYYLGEQSVYWETNIDTLLRMYSDGYVSKS